MPLFRFHAVDAAQRKVSGEIEALSIGAARTQLEAEGLRIETLLPLDAGGEGSRRLRGGDDPAFSAGESQELGGHIADLAAARLPLSSGLAAIARDLPQNRFRRRLERIVEQLKTGNDLATVLSSHEVPPELSALVRAGLESGSLDDVLARYATDRRNAADLRQQILTGLAYPLIVLSLAVLLFVACLVWIVPNFKPILSGLGSDLIRLQRGDRDLPLLTDLVLALSNLVIDYGVPIGVGLLVTCAAIWYFVRSSRRERSVGNWLCRVPVAGRLLRHVAFSRYANLLALLIESKMTLPSALRLAGASMTDVELRQASENLAQNVESGEPLSAAAHAAHFPSSFIEALTWQQHRGNLADALRGIGQLFENRVRSEAEYVILVFEPVVIIIAGGLLMLLVLAMVIPVLTLTRWLI